MLVRDFHHDRDLAAARDCFVELQEFERTLDPRLPPGAPIADQYLAGLFLRCEEFDGRLFVAEVAGRGRRSLRLRVKGGNDRARSFYARNGYIEYEVELEKPLLTN